MVMLNYNFESIILLYLSYSILGWFAASPTNPRLQQNWCRNRFTGLLHISRMGYNESSCSPEWKVLQLLRRTVSWYNVLHQLKKKNSFLYCKSYYSVRRHFISFHTGVLFTIRFRRKSFLVHFHFAISYCIFFITSGDYSTDFHNSASAG